MTTASDLATPAATAATSPAPDGDLPRIKVSQMRYYIDHPNRARGEQLVAQVFGVTGSNAMDGLLRQVAQASIVHKAPDELNIGFMLEMVKGIGPRDAVEAMLVTQMVTVHVLAMRCAANLAIARDTATSESAARALGRLARTFPAQMDALNRHRSLGAHAVTVQNVSVAGGGNAILGNVTQHAKVIVSDHDRSAAAGDEATVPRRRRRRRTAAAAPAAPA